MSLLGGVQHRVIALEENVLVKCGQREYITTPHPTRTHTSTPSHPHTITCTPARQYTNTQAHHTHTVTQAHSCPQSFDLRKKMKKKIKRKKRKSK